MYRNDVRNLALIILLLISRVVVACEADLAGTYKLQNAEGKQIEVLQLRFSDEHLQGFTKGNAGWELNPDHPKLFSADSFAKFTQQPAPTGYCGITVSGVILARVPKGFRGAGLTVQSGFVLISIAGPREAYRVKH